jgi:hypothetical protein
MILGREKMKLSHKRIFVSGNSAACSRAVEILHTQGIESAELWLNREKINKIYDNIEEQYLKTKKIIYIS